jgi:hypothetical protein
LENKILQSRLSLDVEGGFFVFGGGYCMIALYDWDTSRPKSEVGSRKNTSERWNIGRKE